MGTSFNIGDTIQYRDQKRTVAKAVDSDGYLKVKGVVSMDVKMSEMDCASMNIGAAGAIILAAFLPKW